MTNISATISATKPIIRRGTKSHHHAPPPRRRPARILAIVRGIKNATIIKNISPAISKPVMSVFFLKKSKYF